MKDPHEYTLAEAAEAALANLKRHPLVWIEDGMFIVRDEKLPGARYDFTCRTTGEALSWLAHLAEKTWITKEHLEQFARLAQELPKAGRR